MPELYTKTPECSTEKLVINPFSVFFKSYEKLLYLEVYENCFWKLLYLPKLRKASINKNLLDKLKFW